MHNGRDAGGKQGIFMLYKMSNICQRLLELCSNLHFHTHNIEKMYLHWYSNTLEFFRIRSYYSYFGKG